jgi:hypothetical protein
MADENKWDFWYGGTLVFRGLNTAAKDGAKEIINDYLSKGEFGWHAFGGEPGTPGVIDLFITQGISFHFFSQTAQMQFGDPFGPHGPGVIYGH